MYSILFSLLVLPSISLGANLTWVISPNVNFDTQEIAGVWQDRKYYIGRTTFEGGVVIGFYIPVLDKIWVGVKGKLVQKFKGSSVQILTYHKGFMTWARKEYGDGRLPYNIVLGGIHPETQDHLFVCRARHADALLPGWMSIDEDLCTVGWGDGEHKKEKYELLAISLYGMMRKATV